ncbi:MAG: hypothetical protein ACRDJC_23105 [Thermomicrobiales bacterium]
MCDGSINDSDCGVVGEPCCECAETQCCAGGTCQTGTLWDQCGANGATCQVCAEGEVCASGESCVSCASQSGSTLCDRLTDPESVKCSDQFCHCAEKADGSGSVCYFNPACQASPLPPICATDADCDGVFPSLAAVCILVGTCELPCSATACVLPCGVDGQPEQRQASRESVREGIVIFKGELP